MGTKTKSFTSAMTGAPVLSGTAGALIAVLDAVLVNGFGLQTASSVTITGGIATVNVASTPSAIVGTVVVVAGATPAGLNGEQQVTATTGNSVSFAIGLPDQAATGTITMKVAPAGWSKPFSGTNLAVYKIIDPQGTGFYLRVDDTGATNSRVIGYETMSDVNTGTGLFPSAGQVSGGLYWHKASAANATAIAWEIVADTRGFYLSNAPCMASTATYVGRDVTWFGDINSCKSADGYGCVLSGASSSTISYNYGLQNRSPPSSTSNCSYVARAFTQIGGSASCGRWSPPLPGITNMNNTTSGDSSNCGLYPSAASGSLLTTPLMLLEGVTDVTAVYRGNFPGMYHTPLVIPGGTFATRDIVVATNDLSGRNLMAIYGYGYPGVPATIHGSMFIDITGPWR